MTSLTSRSRRVLVVVLVAVFAGAVWVAGRQDEPPPMTGVARLGPEPGEQVAAYLHRARASLPPPGAGEVWALVEPTQYLDPAAAAALTRGVRLAGVVLRVPLPGVQTALITRDLPGQHPETELATALRSAGQERAQAAAVAPAGSRAGAVATAEATRLRAGCACVLALLVRGDGAALRAVAGRPLVRAVDAADPGTERPDLAVAPLLPEQRDVVGPVPDDAPVPP
jgi:hypothetical protein